MHCSLVGQNYRSKQILGNSSGILRTLDMAVVPEKNDKFK